MQRKSHVFRNPANSTVRHSKLRLRIDTLDCFSAQRSDFGSNATTSIGEPPFRFPRPTKRGDGPSNKSSTSCSRLSQIGYDHRLIIVGRPSFLNKLRGLLTTTPSTGDPEDELTHGNEEIPIALSKSTNTGRTYMAMLHAVSTLGSHWALFYRVHSFTSAFALR